MDPSRSKGSGIKVSQETHPNCRTTGVLRTIVPTFDELVKLALNLSGDQCLPYEIARNLRGTSADIVGHQIHIEIGTSADDNSSNFGIDCLNDWWRFV